MLNMRDLFLQNASRKLCTDEEINFAKVDEQKPNKDCVI